MQFLILLSLTNSYLSCSLYSFGDLFYYSELVIYTHFIIYFFKNSTFVMAYLVAMYYATRIREYERKKVLVMKGVV